MNNKFFKMATSLAVVATTVLGSTVGSFAYDVQKGDTLSKIAKANGVTVQQLCDWNGITNPNMIKPGQVLKVSADGATPTKSTVISASTKAVLKKMFDAKYYAAQNPDVVKVLGSSETALFNHFLKYGLNELRQPSADFNVNAYASAYSDVAKAYGDNIVGYYEHYAVFGQKEGRDVVTLEKAAAKGITVVKAGTKEVIAKADGSAVASSSEVATPVVATGDLEAAVKSMYSKAIASYKYLVNKYELTKVSSFKTAYEDWTKAEVAMTDANVDKYFTWFNAMPAIPANGDLGGAKLKYDVKQISTIKSDFDAITTTLNKDKAAIGQALYEKQFASVNSLVSARETATPVDIEYYRGEFTQNPENNCADESTLGLLGKAQLAWDKAASKKVSEYTVAHTYITNAAGKKVAYYAVDAADATALWSAEYTAWETGLTTGKIADYSAFDASADAGFQAPTNPRTNGAKELYNTGKVSYSLTSDIIAGLVTASDPADYRTYTDGTVTVANALTTWRTAKLNATFWRTLTDIGVTAADGTGLSTFTYKASDGNNYTANLTLTTPVDYREAIKTADAVEAHYKLTSDSSHTGHSTTCITTSAYSALSDYSKSDYTHVSAAGATYETATKASLDTDDTEGSEVGNWVYFESDSLYKQIKSAAVVEHYYKGSDTSANSITPTEYASVDTNGKNKYTSVAATPVYYKVKNLSGVEETGLTLSEANTKVATYNGKIQAANGKLTDMQNAFKKAVEKAISDKAVVENWVANEALAAKETTYQAMVKNYDNYIAAEPVKASNFPIADCVDPTAKQTADRAEYAKSVKRPVWTGSTYASQYASANAEYLKSIAKETYLGVYTLAKLPSGTTFTVKKADGTTEIYTFTY